MWGLLPTWRTPNWGHQVAPVLGPPSFSVIAQARFLNHQIRGGPSLGSVWWTPNWVREYKICVQGGPQNGPDFVLVFRPRGFQTLFLRRCVRGGLIPGSAWWTPNRVRRFKSHSGGLATWQIFRSVFPSEICAGGGKQAEAGKGRQKHAEAPKMRDLCVTFSAFYAQGLSSGPQGPKGCPVSPMGPSGNLSRQGSCRAQALLSTGIPNLSTELSTEISQSTGINHNS